MKEDEEISEIKVKKVSSNCKRENNSSTARCYQHLNDSTRRGEKFSDKVFVETRGHISNEQLICLEKWYFGRNRFRKLIPTSLLTSPYRTVFSTYFVFHFTLQIQKRIGMKIELTEKKMHIMQIGRAFCRSPQKMWLN